ncbi:MAG: hypothetical protein H8E41_07090 [Desulfobulbaceae bacterium]|uniref:Uncharacterized protein n=1 Tax=Candidatus Desulfobia pelagia TaxID=2841692 RepID=A0A8J6NBG5_9BACT|nr:hypothetical protein [Candidatus Desulfobia pelagia]
MKKMHCNVGTVLLFICVFGWGTLGSLPSMAGDESGAELIAPAPFEGRIGYHSYANMTELVTLICDDAMGDFNGFYGPTMVAVKPFTVIGDFNTQKVTLLGITLADQMAAMINSEPAAVYDVEEKYSQKLGGIVEEIDGYLRIHITGRNVRGERRSFVVNVEMSEPLYRALHSYVEVY